VCSSLTSHPLATRCRAMEHDDPAHDDLAHDELDAEDEFDDTDIGTGGDDLDAMGSPEEEVSSGSLSELDAISTPEIDLGDLSEKSPVEIALARREAEQRDADDDETPSPRSLKRKSELDDEDDEDFRIQKRTSGEFLCTSCFLITPKARRANTKTKLCIDCA
jgi:hypothetical protein